MIIIMLVHMARGTCRPEYASDKAHEMLLLMSLHVMLKRDPHVLIKRAVKD